MTASALTEPALQPGIQSGQLIPSKLVRFKFVDSLRGIAALEVLLHHVLHCSVLEPTLRSILPGPIIWLCSVGKYGVQIFFVLSGFVIAHSLLSLPLSRATVGNFILRRQLRLDPPYWCVVFGTLVCSKIESLIPSLTSEPLPSAFVVLLNLIYLQELTAVTRIVSPSWTLCIEIQFYLFFITILVLGNTQKKVAPAIIFLTGLVSLLVPTTAALQPWFIQHWFYFAAGTLCVWAFRKKVPSSLFWAFSFLFLLAATAKQSEGMFFGLITVVALFIAGQGQGIYKWLDFSWLQYLGRISYSLYLTHFLVAIAILKVGYKLTGNNSWFSLIWAVVAIAGSIASAHLLNAFVEQPSMRLASKLKLQR